MASVVELYVIVAFVPSLKVVAFTAPPWTVTPLSRFNVLVAELWTPTTWSSFDASSDTVELIFVSNALLMAFCVIVPSVFVPVAVYSFVKPAVLALPVVFGIVIVRSVTADTCDVASVVIWLTLNVPPNAGVALAVGTPVFEATEPAGCTYTVKSLPAMVIFPFLVDVSVVISEASKTFVHCDQFSPVLEPLL